MANWTTVLTLAAIGFFGVYYFTKMGCKGSDDNGMTGPNGSLCFPGWEAFGISMPGDDESTSVSAPLDDPDIDPGGGGSKNEVKRMAEAQMELVRQGATGDRDPNTGKPLPISAAKRSSLAHAFAAGIEDQITIA